jgi:hypothetical protein
MSDNGCVFQTIKESRGAYFVQYTPARAGDHFASLALVFPEKPAREKIPAIMERECEGWLRHYPIPIMTTAFDDSSSVISLDNERGCDHLIALPEESTVAFHWKLLQNDEFPSGPLAGSRLLQIYHDIPHTTQAERQRNAVSSARSIRLGLIIVALWGIAVPLAVALIGFASPILGWLIIAFSIGKAVWQAVKMLGYVGRNEREKHKDAEQLRMRHHHYHCEHNPKGFEQLKSENFEREAREETRCEAEELKHRQNTAEAGE